MAAPMAARSAFPGKQLLSEAAAAPTAQAAADQAAESLAVAADCIQSCRTSGKGANLPFLTAAAPAGSSS